MGRTQRKRHHKTLRKFVTCKDEHDIILLNSWLCKQGVQYNKKLHLAVFTDTGRGVLTKKKIKPGEELVNLPLNSTINVTSLFMDSDFCSIFDSKQQCLVKYQQSVSFQSLMAFYLTFLNLQGSNSKWYVYLQSLPKSYTVPYFLPKDVLNFIDSDIVNVVNKQRDIIIKSYKIFEEILNSNLSECASVKIIQENFDLIMYEWAYFTVNTRCVYIDLTNIVDLKNIHHTLLNLISDNTKISLCPFLDMINHSPNSKNETKLIVSKGIENVALVNVTENQFSEVRFSIYTKNYFKPYNEVFICYGDSHNLKLITEYGFFLPNNDLDFVLFQYEEMLSYLKSISIKLSQDQINFIHNHSLNKDLYIDVRGLSFNFYGLLMVVKYYYNNMDVSKMIYSAAICSNDKVLNDLITPMIKDKLVSLKSSLENLEKFDKTIILDNCVALMNQYVNLLEKFIEC